jgi:hypothetical protein
MKKNLLQFLLVLLVAQVGYGQLMDPQDIRLPAFLTTSEKAYEFSSMAWWGDRIIMVPAMKGGMTETKAQPVTHSIYYITSEEAGKAIADEDYEVKVDSIEIDRASFDFFVKSKYGYDGIEGTAIIGDHFFFALETKAEDNDKCYVARAYIENGSKGRPKLVFDKTRPIMKSDTGRDGDQGFESLVVLPDSTLMAVFEFSEKEGTMFHKLDRDLGFIKTDKLPVLKATKKSEMYLKDNRLSEMTSDGGVLVGINSIFKDINNSYSELVSFNMKDGKFEAIGSLCLDDCADNWEGLLRFNNGWLLLSDNKFNETVETKLSFFQEKKAKAASVSETKPTVDVKPVKKKQK